MLKHDGRCDFEIAINYDGRLSMLERAIKLSISDQEEADVRFVE